MRRLIALLLSAVLLGLCFGCHIGTDNKEGSGQLEAGPPTSTAGSAGEVEGTDAPAGGSNDSAGDPSIEGTSDAIAATPLSDFYGTYTFKEVSVLSPLSSSSIGSKNEQSAGTAYTVTAELFEIRGPDHTVTVKNPVYEPCELPGKDDVLIQGLKDYASARRVDAQYRILDETGNRMHLKLYTSSTYPDRIWIADYADNTADGTEILVQSMDMLVRSSAYLPDPAQLSIHITGTKDGVEDLLALLEQKKWDMAAGNYGYEFSYDTVFNITPDSMTEEADFQIFKCNTSCLTILTYNGDCYELGIGIGGYGVVDAVLYDYNGDGASELLYTYSWGSGLHRSCAAYFDFALCESVDLDYSAGDEEMMFVTNESGGISLYKAVFQSDSDTDIFTDFSLSAGDFLAEPE